MRTCVRDVAGAIFERALRRGDVTAAVSAAQLLPPLHLGDALSLLVVMAERDPRRYPRAASRWAQRFQAECADVSLEEGQLVAAALAALPVAPGLARPVLRELASSRRLVTVRAVFQRHGRNDV